MSRRKTTAQCCSHKRERLGSDEQAARRASADKGLFILFEGSGNSRVWRFYDKDTGRVVGFYEPVGRKFCASGNRTIVEDGIKAVELAASAR